MQFRTWRHHYPIIGILAFAAFLPAAALAGCGSAFCSLHTQWDVQGTWTEPGTRVDLRFEYIDQDQLRHNKDEISASEIPHQHHNEVRTINRNSLLTVQHAFDTAWGLAVTLPLVDRHHLHIHDHHGELLQERWNYSHPGDLKLLGSYRPDGSSVGLLFGAELPTGKTNILNEAGVPAERSLQPGSGTADILLGGFYQYRTPAIAWFGQLLWQRAVAEQDAFKPGQQTSVDAGLRYEGNSRLGWMLQLNLLDKSSDDGLEAESASSGGRFIHLSPGLSIDINDSLQMYGFVQQAVYQEVRGVQLTAERSFVVGLSSRF
ncbi:MAG TPA: hypothetical protein VGL10_00305 [Gammaproteobacteria bacterium]